VVVHGMARAAVALATVAALASCGLQQGLAQGSDPSPSGPTLAPPINAATITGTPFSWASVRGHAVVLDFWGSWCGPCRAEQADINKLFSKYAARGVVFVGVDMRDDNAAAIAYDHDYAVAYSSVNDADEQIAAAYDVSAPPQLIVIDQHGNIVKRFLGTIVGVTDILDTLH
jgi:thiol-disulfide isomerase/thioredoxin